MDMLILAMGAQGASSTGVGAAGDYCALCLFAAGAAAMLIALRLLCSSPNID
ncbi:MAG: hypothetical protein KGO96_05775 [Elusimicrobia bacterium]|nr:hypothetical protein [Elusimicrobiota bacterium]MDE2425398.1 hypothetical protein [Elusimicrobiota bacterium]